MADTLWKIPEVTVFVQEGGPERLILLAEFASGEKQTVEITPNGVTLTGKKTPTIISESTATVASEKEPATPEKRRSSKPIALDPRD